MMAVGGDGLRRNKSRYSSANCGSGAVILAFSIKKSSDKPRIRKARCISRLRGNARPIRNRRYVDAPDAAGTRRRVVRVALIRIDVIQRFVAQGITDQHRHDIMTPHLQHGFRRDDHAATKDDDAFDALLDQLTDQQRQLIAASSVPAD